MLATKHFLAITKNNLYFHLQTFEKNLVSSCCVMSFLHRSLVNATFPNI